VTMSMIIGIESFNWQMSDFDKMIQFCKQHLIDRVILKTYEITQGEWYQSIGGTPKVVAYIKNNGLDVLTYGYYYGDDPITEANAIKDHLRAYGSHMIDLEGEFDNNQGKAVGLQGLLALHPGTLYLSTWANPASHGWSELLKILDPIIDVYMPQCYDDALVKAMYDQWIRTAKPIQPTFDIIGTPFVDAKSFHDFSLWEYQKALQNAGLLDNFVKIQKGISVATAPTNDKGAVFNAVQVSQFQPQHSEFECGAFTTAITNFSAPPTELASYPTSDIISWAESQYASTAGNNGPSNEQGATIDNMHQYFVATHGNLHWWDTSISVNSNQDSDLATIRAALAQGYPVIATVSESSVFDMDLGRNPYWWGPAGTHILVWVGVSSDGNLLAYDVANVIEGDGNLQTPKAVQPWPRRYRASSIDNQWASIIKLPWLPSIPSNDPTSWPPYTGSTNLSHPPIGGTQLTDNSFLNTAAGQQAKDTWNSTASMFGGTAPRFDSGIALAWQAEYAKNNRYGPPLSQEYTSMTWQGGSIVAQNFAHGWCEWWSGNPHWYLWGQL
jgi:hypothetical protein